MRLKGDVRIGERTYEEITRLFPGKKPTAIARVIGCERRSIHAWRGGETPSGIYLQRLCYLGADIDWILTGRRKDT